MRPTRCASPRYAQVDCRLTSVGAMLAAQASGTLLLIAGAHDRANANAL
jgi:hypothetical protein